MRSKKMQNKLAMHQEQYKINILSILTGGAFAGKSMAIDMQEAGAIFDSARTANGAFTNMSDIQIIDYCNGLEAEEMMGMVNLVHGRYFEELVADASGGMLFDAKNHPDTDMLLNGSEYSIKSNDVTADSITDFETYSPQNLGLNDDELRERTVEVIDGDIIDATDAIMSGALGFGTMATLQAVGEGAEEWETLQEWEKTKMKATVVGTKTIGKASAGTVKSLWGLTKLAGKGFKKGYEVHQDFRDSGGYEKIKKEFR